MNTPIGLFKPQRALQVVYKTVACFRGEIREAPEGLADKVHLGWVDGGITEGDRAGELVQ